MATAHTLDSVRDAIRVVLTDFAKRPFFNLREADPQAGLLIRIREALNHQLVPAMLT